MLDPSMTDAMARGDPVRVARLTREARLYGLDDLTKRGLEWLQPRGYSL
jgi:hypothetical protein